MIEEGRSDVGPALRRGLRKGRGALRRGSWWLVVGTLDDESVRKARGAGARFVGLVRSRRGISLSSLLVVCRRGRVALSAKVCEVGPAVRGPRLKSENSACRGLRREAS